MSAGYSSRCSSCVATGQDLLVDEAAHGGEDLLLHVGQTVGLRQPSHVTPLPSASARPSSGRPGCSPPRCVDVGGGGHHHLAPEDAHQGAVLVVALGLHVHDAAVVLRLRRGLVQHGRLAVERVAVEGGRHVPQRLDLQVGDRLAGHVGHGHAQQQRVHVVADHDVPAEVGGLTRVVGVQVERVVVHRQQAEQMVVVLGDRLAGPVLVDGPDLELLEGASELHRQASGGWKEAVRRMPAARPLPATTSAILRLASSIISSPSIAEPFVPPASEVCHS